MVLVPGTTKPKSTRTTYRLEEVWGQGHVYTCAYMCTCAWGGQRPTLGSSSVTPTSPACPSLLPPPLHRFLGGTRVAGLQYTFPSRQGLSLRPSLLLPQMGLGVCSHVPTLMDHFGGLNSGPYQALDPWSHLSAKPSF